MLYYYCIVQLLRTLPLRCYHTRQSTTGMHRRTVLDYR